MRSLLLFLRILLALGLFTPFFVLIELSRVDSRWGFVLCLCYCSCFVGKHILFRLPMALFLEYIMVQFPWIYVNVSRPKVYLHYSVCFCFTFYSSLFLYHLVHLSKPNICLKSNICIGRLVVLHIISLIDRCILEFRYTSS